jgi:membrane-bound lytic murein transglycosylase D
MKLKNTLMLFGLMLLAAAYTQTLRAQTGKTYQQMSQRERAGFVNLQARRIAAEMSGRDYDFTPAFIEDVQQAVTHYTKRIGNDEERVLGKRDLRTVFERGRAEAPTITAAFRARNVSPIFGLYLTWIESEFLNLTSQKPMGSIGMFQFLPKTGERFGLSPEDLMDVGKSADAAAQYIASSIEFFKADPMKEALAILAYNRGGPRVTRDLKLLLNEQNKQCSVCALNADRSKLDETYRFESVYYVPRFFAAAIIGENPQAFGVQSSPLSTF